MAKQCGQSVPSHEKREDAVHLLMVRNSSDNCAQQFCRADDDDLRAVGQL
jgi:hypothetical protein